MMTKVVHPAPVSLHSHSLGKIARFIDIAPEVNGEVISEKLQWNRSENGMAEWGRI